jgi:hypothetical protein
LRAKKLPRRVHERLQVVVQVHRGAVAVFGVLREGLEHDGLELVGDLSVVARGRHDLDVADLLQGGEIRLADEQPLHGEQLVQADAHGEHVAAAVDLQASHLLGGHVPELALEDPRLGLRALARGLGDAEVDELHVAVVRDEDVLRRHVAVHQLEGATRGVLLVVGVVEALAELHDQ